MNFAKQSLVLSLVCLSLVLTAGCGKATDKYKKARPKTVPAEADVTYKGSPVIGATIVISSIDGKYGAAGMTDSSGHVVLKTYPPDEGAVPGSYNVGVTLMETVNMPVLPDGVHAEDVKLPKPKSLIPPKYSDPNKSGLKLDIPSGGKTDMTIDLPE